MAGLSAASALGRHFEEVVVLERDVLPSTSTHRAGVPQAHHSHALLASGQASLDRLFPGFLDRLASLEVPVLDYGRDVAMLTASRWLPPQTSGVDVLFASRVAIEGVARSLLARRSNVRIVERARVEGLITRPGRRSRVGGLRTSCGDLSADLVVVADGRRTRAPRWLRDAGLQQPPESIVDASIRYRTRWYDARSAPRHSWRALLIHPRIPEQRAASLFPCEGGRWIVTIVSIGPSTPSPRCDGEFEEALAALPSPAIAQALKDARPASRIFGIQAMPSILRHWDRLDIPGFLAIGDAVCAPNPIYSQGMTLAALSSERLDEWLGASRSAGLEPRSFLRRQARLLADPWKLAIGADFRFPDTTGPRPWAIGAINRFVDEVYEASGDWAHVARTFHEVLNVQRAPAALFSPGVVGTVARQVLARGRRAEPAGEPLDAGEPR